MKLLIFTQYFENYAWREDGSLGTGEQAYWKAKGGNEYVVKNFTDFTKATEVVMALRPQVEMDNDACREWIVDWEVVADDHLTESEKMQLDFEGFIEYPAKELKWAA